MIDPGHKKITISRQCDLIGISKVSYYYESKRDDSYSQMIMNLIDERITKMPFYGVPRITAGRRHGQNSGKRLRDCRGTGNESLYKGGHF
jgi:putative transposase